mmetsp:Transcript_45961/g.103812  ORF Transcript_45961/g.103812 Transcript_45961/m.103812 type:complete len:672 (+) Transcript_45961:60-2075(+)
MSGTTLVESVLSGDLPLCDASLALGLALRTISARLLGAESDWTFALGVTAFFLAFSSFAGHVLLFVFYKHAVTTVFSAKIPPVGSRAHRTSHLEVYLCFRPLEAAWRWATKSWRRLPDVLVIGEVRCGTGSLCAHLAALPGATPGFSPWKPPPELGLKSSSSGSGYFTGLWLGRVGPKGFRAAFPVDLAKAGHPKLATALASVRGAMGAAFRVAMLVCASSMGVSLQELVAGASVDSVATEPEWAPRGGGAEAAEKAGEKACREKPMTTVEAARSAPPCSPLEDLLGLGTAEQQAARSFRLERTELAGAWAVDECAELASSPAAPHLVARAYLAAGEPPPVLVMLVRDPVSQALSHWRQQARHVAWTRAMGLEAFDDDLRGPGYPPNRLAEALELADSRPVRVACAAAQALARGSTGGSTGGSAGGGTGSGLEEVLAPVLEDSGEKSALAARAARDACGRSGGSTSKGCDRLPDWAAACGGMAAVGRCGSYAGHLEKWEASFRDAFGPPRDRGAKGSSSSSFVEVLDMSDLGRAASLRAALKKIARRLRNRFSEMAKGPSQDAPGGGRDDARGGAGPSDSDVDFYFDRAAAQARAWPDSTAGGQRSGGADGGLAGGPEAALCEVWLNKGHRVGRALEPSPEEVETLRARLQGERSRLERLTGRKFEAWLTH